MFHKYPESLLRGQAPGQAQRWQCRVPALQEFRGGRKVQGEVLVDSGMLLQSSLLVGKGDTRVGRCFLERKGLSIQRHCHGQRQGKALKGTKHPCLQARRSGIIFALHRKEMSA